MPCIPIPGGIMCTGRARRKRCSHPGCDQWATLQCDWPLAGDAAGKTCDRDVCARHAVHVGPDRDYCMPHARLEAEREKP